MTVKVRSRLNLVKSPQFLGVSSNSGLALLESQEALLEDTCHWLPVCITM